MIRLSLIDASLLSNHAKCRIPFTQPLMKTPRRRLNFFVNLLVQHNLFFIFYLISYVV